jgi:RecB family endonuclease NucS
LIQFRRTIGDGEEHSYFLNLTDDDGITYGSYFPEDRTQLWIITPSGKKYPSSKRGNNQIWGALRSWYWGEDVHSGAIIQVTYDESSQPIDGRVPVSIEVLKRMEGPAIIQTVSESPGNQLVNEIKEFIPAEISLKFEKDLEDFLVENLNLVEPGLSLFFDESGRSGRQYQTDIGNIDILCKNQGEIIVIELKKGRVGDQVVGQISRYIGWTKEFLAKGQNVRGIIIVHDYDPKLKYAVRAHENLRLKYYEIQLRFISEEEAINRL